METQSTDGITAADSFLDLMPSTLVRYQGQQVRLSPRGVRISTSTRLALRAYDLVVSPATANPTRVEAADKGDTMVIMVSSRESSRRGNTSTLDKVSPMTYGTTT